MNVNIYTINGNIHIIHHNIEEYVLNMIIVHLTLEHIHMHILIKIAVINVVIASIINIMNNREDVLMIILVHLLKIVKE